MYLYSFPMQQLALQFTGNKHLLAFIGVSFALTFACAAASWRLIEKPALRLKG